MSRRSPGASCPVSTCPRQGENSHSNGDEFTFGLGTAPLNHAAAGRVSGGGVSRRTAGGLAAACVAAPPARALAHLALEEAGLLEEVVGPGQAVLGGEGGPGEGGQEHEPRLAVGHAAHRRPQKGPPPHPTVLAVAPGQRRRDLNRQTARSPRTDFIS